MTPEFSSTELNNLLQLEMSDGIYASPEDALTAGLRVLRERGEFELSMADRLNSFRDRRAAVLEGDAALGEFLDAIDDEVDAELRSASNRKP